MRLRRLTRPPAAVLALGALLSLAGCVRVPPPALLPPADASSLAADLAAWTSAPVVPGNRVDILLNGEQIFPAMLAAIRPARRTITFAQYSYGQGKIARDLADALADRCLAGVGVDVLLDAFGSRNIAPEAVDRMRRAGCHVAFFRPLARLGGLDERNHRRLLVVDGRLGFTGGAGVGTKWTGDGRRGDHWRDTDVRVEGPVVEYLQRAFAENWREATGLTIAGDAYYPRLRPEPDGVRAQVIAGSPGAGRFAVYSMFRLALAAARRTVSITNPYFVPDGPLTAALADAVRRGVRVRVIAPGPIDYNVVRRASRSSFGRLLRGGVEIYEYDPALLHAKTLVVDGEWATVGSANLDNRSFAINDEANLVVYDAGVAGRLQRVFEDDLRYSRRVEYARWRSRGLGTRLLEWFTYPLRDLM